MSPRRLLWLLSYLGLSLALGLGEQRQSGALEAQPQQAARRAARHWQQPRESEAPRPRRPLLLDELLSNALLELPRALPVKRRISASRRQQSAHQQPSAHQPSGRQPAAHQQQQQQQEEAAAQALAQAGGSLAASNFMFNSRSDRSYDVPLIECPMSEDGMERFACPTADRMGRYHCIDDHVLCDGYLDCPMGEDEDMQACMFYRTTKAHIDILADALLRWARGR